MKHGLLLLALTCWFAGAAVAGPVGKEAPQALTLGELEAVEGGDLFLGVDRNRQMMTVTQVTPGQYYGSQSYSVKVTTSVVQNKEVTPQNAKGDMTNSNRLIATTATSKGNEPLFQLAVQYPSGTYSMSSQTTTRPNIQGPVIQTSASQRVPVVTSSGTLVGSTQDYGYNIHYANPATTTNTLGCIGVQNLDSMVKLAATLKADSGTYSSPTLAKQTVTVSAYTSDTPPATSTFLPGAWTSTSTSATPSSTSKTTSTSTSSSSSSSSSAAKPAAVAATVPTTSTPAAETKPVSSPPSTKAKAWKEL